mgnify:CR=1 FL=1
MNANSVTFQTPQGSPTFIALVARNVVPALLVYSCRFKHQFFLSTINESLGSKFLTNLLPIQLYESANLELTLVNQI